MISCVHSFGIACLALITFLESSHCTIFKHNNNHLVYIAVHSPPLFLLPPPQPLAVYAFVSMGGNNDSQFVIFMGFLFFINCVRYVRQIVQPKLEYLTSESVEGLALPLEGIDNIHGGDGLPASMLGVGDGVTMTFSRKTLGTPQVSS